MASSTLSSLPKPLRRDAAENHRRILQAAREVLGEYGPEASVEQVATRAGVGVGTVYRRFASKDALIDELIGLAWRDLWDAAERALALDGRRGLEHFLFEIGTSLAGHARYAHLMLDRDVNGTGMRRIRQVVDRLTRRAVAAGDLNPHVTGGDVMSVLWSLRGLVEVTGEVAPSQWRRFLDIHLAGLGADGALSEVPPLTPSQLGRLVPGLLPGRR